MTGPTGPTGATGATGPRGTRGTRGTKGTRGTRGTRGSVGDTDQGTGPVKIGGSAQGQAATLIFCGGTGAKYIKASAATAYLCFEKTVRFKQRATAPTSGGKTGMLWMKGATLKVYNGATWVALH